MKRFTQLLLPRGFAARFLAAVAILSAALTLPAAAEAQDMVRQLIGSSVTDIGPQYKDVEDAVTYFRYGNIARCRETLEAAVKKNPQLGPADMLLARMLFLANQIPAAQEALEQTVSKSPTDPEAYLTIGEVAFQSRRVTEAQLAFEKADALCREYKGNDKRKRSMQIRIDAGMVATSRVRKDWATAQKYINDWLGLEPDSAAAKTQQAEVTFAQGDPTNAYKLFQALYEKDKTRLRPEISMAMLYQADGKATNAKQLIQLAVERDPNTANTRLAAASWALENGELALAKENVLAAIATDPNSLQAKMLQGLLARYDKDFAKASDAFEAAHLLAPSNFGALNQLAISLIELPDETKRAKALEYARLNAMANNDLKQQPGRDAVITLGWVLFKLGNEAEAEQTIAAALQNGGVSFDSAYYAAQMLRDRGKPEQARQILQPMLEQKKEFPTRAQAEDLLKKLPAAGTTTDTPPDTPPATPPATPPTTPPTTPPAAVPAPEAPAPAPSTP